MATFRISNSTNQAEKVTTYVIEAADFEPFQPKNSKSLMKTGNASAKFLVSVHLWIFKVHAIKVSVRMSMKNFWMCAHPQNQLWQTIQVCAHCCSCWEMFIRDHLNLCKHLIFDVRPPYGSDKDWARIPYWVYGSSRYKLSVVAGLLISYLSEGHIHPVFFFDFFSATYNNLRKHRSV